MKGFFSGEEVVHRVRKTRGSKETSSNIKSMDPCEQCGLYKGCVSPKMEVTGKGGKKILIIAEAPGKTEDEQGIQLIGEAGQILRNCLEELDYNLDRDFWKTNIINCRPPGNRKPTRKEMKFCFPRLEETIQKLNPEFIWLMGGSALDGFFTDDISDLNITKYRRRLIPYEKYNCWVIPLFHPSYILRQGNEESRNFFLRDLRWALSCTYKLRPVIFRPEKYVKALTSLEDIVKVFDKIEKNKIIAFDYETTSLNPYRDGQKIWTIGVALSSVEAYSFGYQHPESISNSEIIKEKWTKILTNPEIEKIAHNLKFEDAWSRQIFKVVPQGWISDTMTSQHILDDRRGTTGLKTQAFLRWGIKDYEKEVSKYMSTESNGLNTIGQMPIHDVCTYNGIDALLTFKLYEEQQNVFQRMDGLSKANDFFLKGILAFCDIEEAGIGVDSTYYEKEEKRLTIELNILTDILSKGEEAKKFQKITGRELSLTSSKDLRELFYKILGLSSPKTTDSGVESVDFEALQQINSAFVVNLLKMRKILKIRDTYLAQFKREQTNGRIHPSFSLHVAESFRSSSHNPNFQNIPVRDEDARKTIRRGVIPSPGYKLMEVDYSAIEVRIAACYTHDPKLISYIHDPKTDMHRDQACEIFLLKKDQVNKDIRFYAKNGFVFPQFYGSTYKVCSANLWEVAKDLKTAQEVPLLEHLKKQRIKNYYNFVDHVQIVERDFWRKFSVFKEWQEKAINFYYKKGYIETIFGHRRGGFLSRNQIINTPIQGTAFHCLLWSLIQVNNLKKAEGWKTRLIGQIHDSLVIDLHPEEQDYVIPIIRRIMCEDLRKAVPEIIVPLEVEVDITEINGSWYTKKGLQI